MLWFGEVQSPSHNSTWPLSPQNLYVPSYASCMQYMRKLLREKRRGKDWSCFSMLKVQKWMQISVWPESWWFQVLLMWNLVSSSGWISFKNSVQRFAGETSWPQHHIPYLHVLCRPDWYLGSVIKPQCAFTEGSRCTRVPWFCSDSVATGDGKGWLWPQHCLHLDVMSSIFWSHACHWRDVLCVLSAIG